MGASTKICPEDIDLTHPALLHESGFTLGAEGTSPTNSPDVPANARDHVRTCLRGLCWLIIGEHAAVLSLPSEAKEGVVA